MTKKLSFQNIAKILPLVAIFFFLSATTLAAGPNVLDVKALMELGLTDDTIEDLMKASLTPRARPPLHADFITTLASYGGNPLTRAYLDLDMSTAHLKIAPVTPVQVSRMIARKVDTLEIISTIKAAQIDRELPPSAGNTGGIEESDILGDYNNTGIVAAGAGAGAGAMALRDGANDSIAMGNGATNPGAGTQFAQGSNSIPEDMTFRDDSDEAFNNSSHKGSQASPQLAAPTELPLSSTREGAMAAGVTGTMALEMAGSSLEYGVPPMQQSLAGLPQIPDSLPDSSEASANKNPEPDKANPYPIREPSEEDTFYMGSYETVTPDGHRVNVHRNSQSGYLGTAVESTPSGHTVHRYFSGKPSSTQEGARGSDKPKNSNGGTPRELSDFLP